MHFNDFIDTIIDSDAEDWHRVGYDGLIFRDVLSPLSQNGQLIDIEHDAHRSRVVYKSDIDIALEWGLTENRDFKEEWANGFADQSARSSFLDLSYRGQIIHRELIVSVDGGRCYLPLPNPTTLEVPRRKERLVRLVQEITGMPDFDRYFNGAGMTTVEAPWP